MNWSEKVKLIKAIILDIDGVLTNGQIGYGCNQGNIIKFFDVKDGHAIKMALRSGLLVGVLSGRQDQANRLRMQELSLSFSYEGEKNKGSAFDRLLLEQKLKPEECLFVGDDVIDIPVLMKAGIGVCVNDAVDEVKEISDWETTNPGGKGAVREIIVRILKEQNRWNSVISRYTDIS